MCINLLKLFNRFNLVKNSFVYIFVYIIAIYSTFIDDKTTIIYLY